jgi:cyclic pyranopterin phosphate synthase
VKGVKEMNSYDFANILLSGPCNLRCPDCIGRQLPGALSILPSNLGLFPLKGLSRFTRALRAHGVTQVTLTGTNTDPQLYSHEERLLAYLRRRVPGVRVSLHTNGVLALRRIRTFNRYDRATISLPSFSPRTCRLMTGRAHVLDLERIISAACIPIKISTLVTRHNLGEIPEILARCRALGLRRVVLRKLYGQRRPGSFDLLDLFSGQAPVGRFGGQPIFRYGEMEVTIWDFSRASLRCLNLFSDGTIGTQYELERNAALQDAS